MQSFATLINIKKDMPFSYLCLPPCLQAGGQKTQVAYHLSLYSLSLLSLSFSRKVFFFKPRHKTDRHNRKVTPFCNEIEILLKNNSFLAYNYISY